MRIGFITGRAGHGSDNESWTDAGLGRLIDAVGSRVDHLTVAMSYSPIRRALHDHRVAATDVRWLPPMPSVARGFVRFGEVWAQLRNLER